MKHINALLLQLEFPTWKLARPWTYGASFAVGEGLTANGVNCLTVPVTAGVPSSSQRSWLSHARRLLKGQQFDQVWIWLVHTTLDRDTLDWIADLAPVRIGFVMESLRYEDEDYAVAPELRPRAQVFYEQLEYLTHALLCDERDAADLTAQSQKPALWWPGFVPRRFILSQDRPPIHRQAAFHGNPYGGRAHWINHPVLRQAMIFAKSAGQLTSNQQRFDEVQSLIHNRLLQQPPVTEGNLRRYVHALQTAREAEFRDWLNGLTEWAGIVNLPGLTRCFGGRVFEAMAVGRPVISWEIPERPKTNALFENGREIVLFSPHSPDDLAQRIEYALSDQTRGHAIGIQGQRKLLAYHTAERRMRQLLDWIDSGKEPDYGVLPTAAEQPTGVSGSLSVSFDRSSVTEPDGSMSGPAARSEQPYERLKITDREVSMTAPGEARRSAIEDSPLERQHEKFFLQKVQVSHELAGVDRLEVFRRLCEGKHVLHIGCVDYPLFDPRKNLHIQLEKCCAALDGFDVNDEGLERMRPFIKGKLLSKWEDIRDEYDLVLVPEVMEHVPNVKEFLGRIARIRASRVIITVPDAFQCFQRHFDYNRETNTFVEVVHPDHNCWYTPYTLTNTINKYTDWAIEGVWFVNGISVMAIATVKQLSSKPGQGIVATSAGQPKVLLACDYYWPSHGGVETIAANLGASLGQCGYEVEIAARSLPERLEYVHQGMVIHSLDANTQTPEGLPTAARQLRSLIESGRYVAVIMMADPLTWVLWSLEGAQVPSHTRVFVQPLINEDGYARWKDNETFRQRLTGLLRRATHVASLTHKGPDARFLESEHIPFVSIPNATTPESAPTDFRSSYGFEQGRPLVVHVGNLWRVKNQIGLIRSFRTIRLDVQIALIGNPSGEKDYENAVRSEVPKDPRFKLLTGLYGEKIAAAMQAADLVVLPSLGEVFPVSLLEAMSHGKAWLATPECGAANELAGGIIAPVEQFPAIVERLLANPDLLSRFGCLGRLHWETCFQWSRVSRVWSDLIQEGAKPSSWAPCPGVWEETLSLRQQILGDEISLRSSTTSAVPRKESPPNRLMIEPRPAHATDERSRQLPLVSVIVPTHDRPTMLPRALQSILSQTYDAVEILVIDDGKISAAAQVMAMDHGGRIRYVWNGQHRERSFSRNEGLQLARGKYIAYLDDDDIFYPDHLATLVEVLEQTGCKVAYTDAHRAYQERAGDGTYITRGRDLPYSNDFDRDLILVNNLLPICCLMHERACLDTVGLFDETLATHEDWDFLIRLSRHYMPTHIKRVTAEFSWRTDGSTSTSSQQEDFKRTRAVIFERYVSEAHNNPKIVQLQRSILKQDGQSTQAASFDCSIVIPVWNKVELTKQCLIALAHVTTDVSYEVIVVDNGSTDGTHEFLQSLSGDVRVIRNQENLGFAKACNQGAAAAGGKFLVFLNNDTIPLEGWLTALVEEVKNHPEVAIVGSKLLYPGHTVQHAGVAIDRHKLIPYHVYRGFSDTHPAVNKRRELNAVTGACLLIRRRVFTEVGGFDDTFVNGFEDMDLCFKVREKKWCIVYQPRSVLFHLESQTPGRKLYDEANAQRLRQRWGRSWWLADEDSLYVSDGYKAVAGERNGQVVTDLQLIEAEQDRHAWELVAATQRAGHQRDEAAVVTHLGKCADWPADRWVLKWAAGVAEAIQQPSLAAEFTRRVALLDDPAREQVTIVREALAKGQVTTAASRLEALLKDYPSHAEGLLLRAILHMQREQYREAEMAFTTALHQGADRRKCLMGIGMASMGRSYPQGAWETFERVLAEHPDDAEVIHWLLRAGTAQNRWQELSVQLRNYLARNPSDLSVRFAYASVLLRAEQIEAARQEYNQLEALAPTHDGLSELGQAIAGKEAVLAMDVSG